MPVDSILLVLTIAALSVAAFRVHHGLARRSAEAHARAWVEKAQQEVLQDALTARRDGD